RERLYDPASEDRARRRVTEVKASGHARVVQMFDDSAVISPQVRRAISAQSCTAWPTLHSRTPTQAASSAGFPGSDSRGTFQWRGITAEKESSSKYRSGCPAAIISWSTNLFFVPRWHSRHFSVR